MPAERFPFSERFQTYEARVSAPTKACLAPRHGYSSRSAHRSTAMSSGLCLFLFEFSAIALIVMDGNNRIILVNSKAGKLFGCGRAELFAETIDTLTLEGIRFTNAGSREGGEVRGQRKNGSEVPIQVSRSAIPLEGGGGALVTLVDITEHKKAEERFFTSD